jgi:putative endonuclease
MANGWCVYMVRCADDSLYTGIANDIERRLQEHNEGPRGAKYTRARRPVTLVYTETVADRSAAAKREAELRRMSRQEKEALIQG